MLKNYLKVALRNLWKSLGFTAINIIGLATGLGVCLLIVLYVTDELSYDKHYQYADRIYRLDADIYLNNTQFISATSPKPMAPELVKDYPQVEQMVRISYFNSPTDIMIKKGDVWVQDHHLAFADSTFFKVFTLPMIAGDPNTALNEPHSIDIDASAARRYFNSTDVVGKTLELDDKTICKITGVMQDMPRQSSFHFSFIRPLHDSWSGDDQQWVNNSAQSYILVRPGTDRASLQKDVDLTTYSYVGRALEAQLHITTQGMKEQGGHIRYRLMPLTDIHLHSNKSYEFEANGNSNYIYVFSFIAILILIIACVNFMNLSTARSANRAKEVGIRKVAGSTRGNLIIQFLTESLLLTLAAMLLALGFAVLLLPMFNTLSGKELHATILFTPPFITLLATLVLVVGCLAGSYPAFYLSSFQPIKVLKGAVATGFKSSWLRSSLVVFQFFISIALIIGTLVIYRQLSFIRNRGIGFDRDQVLVIHNTGSVGKEITTFRKELPQLSGVAGATLASDLPTQGSGYNQTGWFRSATTDAKAVVVVTDLEIDENYAPTLGMTVVKGRNFSHEFPTDSLGILVNEAAVRLLGWKDPLNQHLYKIDDNGKPYPYHVVGILKDFNYNSMHEKVGPVVLRLADRRETMAVRLTHGDMYAKVKLIESKWKALFPGMPFSYTFMDNDFDRLYHAEAQTGQVFITFAVFAILIACLGLFGLVTYAAEQRTREIGIRKVLGASTGGLMSLLSRDFLKLVLIAALIAFPIAWWAMNKWLESFAYRVGISWWVFFVAGLAAILIALVTVSIQTLRAAVANPVKSLRSE
ncbi:MAG TPA: ABC transporter permease [Puia sp.]|nr:ABC transporter permease [Puia sp.]